MAATPASDGKRDRSSRDGAAVPGPGEELVAAMCGTLTARLSPARFGPGFRSRCFLVPGREDLGWLRPKELQELADRASSHDWQRCIRVEGRTLKHWINADRFKVCEKECPCHLCRAKATSPVRGRPKVAPLTVDPASAEENAGKMPGVGGKKRTSADRDSDSGVSSVSASYAKTLRLEAGKAAAMNSQDSGSNVLLDDDDTDYLALIQEALAALNTSTSTSSSPPSTGVSLMHVLLYVLHHHPESDSLGPEEVSNIHKRVRHGLLFLSRMGVVDKFRCESAAAGPSDSDAEDIESNSVLFSAKEGEAKPEAATTSTSNKNKSKAEGKSKVAKKGDTDKVAKVGKAAKADKDTKGEKVSKGDKKSAKGKVVKGDGKRGRPKLGLKVKSKVSAGKPTKKSAPKSDKNTEKAASRSSSSSSDSKPSSNDAPPTKKRKLSLSPELSFVCGGARALTHVDALKEVYGYARAHNLYHPTAKTVILADEALRRVTKRKKVTQVELVDAVKKHLRPIPTSDEL